MLKVFAGLPNLRKAGGAAGDIGRIDAGEGLCVYLGENATLWPFPASMKVEWDLVPDVLDREEWEMVEMEQ